MRIDRIDHFVLTVASIDATCDFYSRVLGMEVETFRPDDGTVRTALRFGIQKINLHEVGKEFSPRAQLARPGTGDFCLITTSPISEVTDRLARAGVEIEIGPVARDGATGPMTSVYLRDPDGNLVEIARYDT